MSRHLAFCVGFGLLTSAGLSLTGCMSSPKTAMDDAPAEVRAAAAQNQGWWSRMKSWAPTTVAAVPSEEKIQNPGKLYLSYAHLQESVGNLIAAREAYEQALGDDPKSADAILGLARLDQLNGRSYEAEQRFLKAQKLKPRDPGVLDAVGQFYASQQQWDKSIELLSEAMRIDPDAASHRFHLAVALAKSGRIDVAMPHFSRTVGDAEGHYNVGYILYQQNDFDGAERHLVQAVVKRPDLVPAQQLLDEVRHKRDEGTMFARGQPQRPGSAPAAAGGNAGRVERVAASYAPQESGLNQVNVVPAGSAAAAGPHDYRMGYDKPQNGKASTPAVPAPARTRPLPAPWQTSAENDTPSPPPLGAATPAASGPTAEQLEQLRNQLSN